MASGGDQFWGPNTMNAENQMLLGNYDAGFAQAFNNSQVDYGAPAGQQNSFLDQHQAYGVQHQHQRLPSIQESVGFQMPVDNAANGLVSSHNNNYPSLSGSGTPNIPYGANYLQNQPNHYSVAPSPQAQGLQFPDPRLAAPSQFSLPAPALPISQPQPAAPPPALPASQSQLTLPIPALAAQSRPALPNPALASQSQQPALPNPPLTSHLRLPNPALASPPRPALPDPAAPAIPDGRIKGPSPNNSDTSDGWWRPSDDSAASIPVVSSSRKDKRARNAKADPSHVYKQRLATPAPWGQAMGRDGQPQGNYIFVYTNDGEWQQNLCFTTEELWLYMSECPRPVKVLVQHAPAQVNHRISVAGRQCRWAHCPNPGRTIGAGWIRVSFDEYQTETTSGKRDPFKVAGSMHLFCFEQCFDPCVLFWQKKLMPEERDFPREQKNPMALTRDSDKEIIKRAFAPWMRKHANEAPIKWPRPHRESLSFALVSFHLDHQTGARQATRLKRNATRPDHHRKTLDVHKGDLVEFVKRSNREKATKRKQKRAARGEDRSSGTPLSDPEITGVPDRPYSAVAAVVSAAPAAPVAPAPAPVQSALGYPNPSTYLQPPPNQYAASAQQPLAYPNAPGYPNQNFMQPPPSQNATSLYGYSDSQNPQQQQPTYQGQVLDFLNPQGAPHMSQPQGYGNQPYLQANQTAMLSAYGGQVGNQSQQLMNTGAMAQPQPSSSHQGQSLQIAQNTPLNQFVDPIGMAQPKVAPSQPPALDPNTIDPSLLGKGPADAIVISSSNPSSGSHTPLSTTTAGVPNSTMPTTGVASPVHQAQTRVEDNARGQSGSSSNQKRARSDAEDEEQDSRPEKRKRSDVDASVERQLRAALERSTKTPPEQVPVEGNATAAQELSPSKKRARSNSAGSAGSQPSDWGELFGKDAEVAEDRGEGSGQRQFSRSVSSEFDYEKYIDELDEEVIEEQRKGSSQRRSPRKSISQRSSPQRSGSQRGSPPKTESRRNPPRNARKSSQGSESSATW
ncbi:hypothetical protein B0T10DRAFT_177505 [Thelonectria olida]|uniref:Uncharacterized protein n=1 Tax=Thelonectria olida TaxID=1576542 RepID=A0A9P8WHW4_9HYPO|nr:hypothetical protein B0T10DRAFT_177505 [Thelonectria olida]